VRARAIKTARAAGAVVDLGWQSGKRKRKYLSGKTRREVQEKLTAALRSHWQGLPIDLDERETVSMSLDRWLGDSGQGIHTLVDVPVLS
jgi:hypothetical protein